MTDANDNIESNFSFRIFDLYRRFVELLKINPDFLIEFKSGQPKEEICRDMIHKTFQHSQKEDEIHHLLKYLNKNAKTIANHAENTPNNWTDAIKYTDQCKKLIRKYFRTNGIDIKKDNFNLDEVTEGIGEFLHIVPNQVQLEAIKDYLMHDLQNPKRTIIPQQSSTKIKKKSNKSSKESTDVNANDSIEIAMEVIFNDSLKSGYNDDYQNYKKSAEIARLLKENNDKSQNELLHIAEDTKSSLEESVQSVMRVEDSSSEDEDIDIEIESPEYERLKSSNENLTNAVIESPHICKGLKRSSVGYGDYESITKKICTQKDFHQSELSMDQHRSEICSKNDEFSEHEKIRTSTSDSTETLSTVENVKANISPINSKEDLLNILEDIKIKKEEEEIVLLNFDKHTLTVTENSSSKREENYLNPLSMTYHDAFKLMESIMAFCAFKNETSIEEFLILRRTRDKMLWRSLKETKKENQ
ncbi:hypothetical protein TSAR_010888 [Trichomalopsis sarcophagae]|uniref:Uncharacterized protein n=1 Tax=Trichomalopsis sarcophagae TaxID=543379 RepID=A0A232EXS3_9HYME|nr:hypothetical protein TSAR_010888 [Trichomalopsis sarcophagae]